MSDQAAEATNHEQLQRRAATMLLIACGLFAISTFLPWVTARLGVISLNRNVYQFGPNLSLNWTGVIAMFWIVLLLVNGLGNLGVLRLSRAFRVSAWIATIGIFFNVFNGFDVKFPSTSGLVVWSHGTGVWLAVLSGIVALIAAVMDRQARMASTQTGRT